MKKIYYFIALGFALLFGYFYLLNPKITYDIKLPKNVDKVVFFNPAKIKQSFLLDLLKRPSHWKIPSFGEDSASFNLLNTGLDLSKISSLYQVKNLPETYFFKAEISKEEKLVESLNLLGFIAYEDTFFLESDSIYALLKSDYLYLIKGGDFNKSLEAISLEENFKKMEIEMDNQHPKNNHITIKDLKKDLNLNLKVDIIDRQIKWDTYFKSEYLFQNCSRITNSEYSKISFGMPRDKGFFNANKFQKISNFSIDSLYQNAPKEILIALDKPSIETETISEISYDENFEPIEITKEMQTANLRFRTILKSDSAWSIYNYFKQEYLINPEGDKEIFTPFPFEETFIETDSTFLSFQTDSLDIKQKLVPNLIADISIDFEHWGKVNYLKHFHFLSKIKRLKTQATQDSNKLIRLQGFLKLQK